MKELKNFIKESLDKFVINNLKVVFDITPEIFTLNAPETYSESDIQIYLGDVLLKELPSENDKYNMAFGKNKNNINDAYFEYEKFEHSSSDYEDEQINLKWDSHYDEKANDTKRNMFKLTKLKYIILFDKFEILDDKGNDEDIKEIINDIFVNLESNNINEYPVHLKYNPEELSYTE